jgi:hypothetical protein
MDYAVEIKFKELLKGLEEKFGGGMDAQSVLFLIGVQELGLGFQKFSKRQKTELLHVAVCTVLEPYGFYKSIGRDDDNWPHFEFAKPLPPLDERQQQHLIKEAILEYFKNEELDDPTSMDVTEVLKARKSI